jgi:hypothetical protein
LSVLLKLKVVAVVKSCSNVEFEWSKRFNLGSFDKCANYFRRGCRI